MSRCILLVHNSHHGVKNPARNLWTRNFTCQKLHLHIGFGLPLLLSVIERFFKLFEFNKVHHQHGFHLYQITGEDLLILAFKFNSIRCTLVLYVLLYQLQKIMHRC